MRIVKKISKKRCLLRIEDHEMVGIRVLGGTGLTSCQSKIRAKIMTNSVRVVNFFPPSISADSHGLKKNSYAFRMNR